MPVAKNKTVQFLTAFLGVILVAVVFTWVEDVVDLVFISQAGTGIHGVVHFVLVFILLAAAVSLGYFFFKRYQERQVLPLEELVSELAKAGGLAESAAHLAYFVHQIVPDSWVVVYVFNPAHFQLEVQASCDPQGQVTLDSNGSLPKIDCKNKPSDGSDHVQEFKLVHQERQSGAITIKRLRPKALSVRQLHTLQVGSPIAALAMEHIMHRIQASDQIEEVESRRRSLAQDLHDTLAQNIGYLRLKLDQLTCQPATGLNSELESELQRLHATAEEAYEQVRSLLDELNPTAQEELRDSLLKQAQSICQRADLQLSTHQIGLPFPLPVVTRHHLLYIAREAFNNIEKHAQAGHVHLQLLWLENELIVKITDDGSGFDINQPAKAGHYGLWIMNYRAHEVGGDLKITPSEEGRGTEVTLWIPRRQPNPEQDPSPHHAHVEYQGEA